MFNSKDLIDEMDGLRSFAIRLTNNNIADADDLLQSTVLRAIEKKHLFQAGTNLFSWASKIMFNLFVSQYRRKAKFESKYDPESYLENYSVPATQDVIVEMSEVKEAMIRLSPDHREILVMVCVQGMQYAEVSNLLHVPVGTVRSRLSRAREALQNILDQAKPARTMPYMPGQPYQPTSMAA